MYRGDIALGSTIDLKFTTVNTSGVPTTLAGTPAISAYVDNGTTEITAGITLTADFDSRTGLNNVRIVATSGNGFAAGTNVDLVITTGTVGGSSVVGYVIGSFSIEARSALRPTTAGRTLVVDASGLADATAVKVGPSGSATAQTAGDIPARLPAALVSGRMDSSVGAYQSGLTPLQPTVAGRTLDVSAGGEAGLDWANIGSPTTTVGLSGTTIKAVTDGVALSAAAVQAVWDALTSALTTVGSIGKLLVDNIDAAITSRLAPTTAGRTLDVTATGEAGIDWNNIGAPTTTVNLSGTTIKTATDVEADTQDIQTRLPAALTANGNMKSSLVEILTTALTETAGQLAGAFKKWFNVAAPTGTVNSLPDAVAGAAGGVAIVGSDMGSVASVVADVGITQTGADKVWASAARTLTSFGSLVADVATAVWGAATRTLSAFAFAVDLSATAVDNIWDEAVDGTVTARESVRLANSANGGKLSGAATTSVKIRDLADTKDRVTATVDASGNRTAVTRNLS
jgi:hypothetical protein